MASLERFADIGYQIWNVVKYLVPGLLIIIAIYTTASFVRTGDRVLRDIKEILKSPWFILLFALIVIVFITIWFYFMNKITL